MRFFFTVLLVSVCFSLGCNGAPTEPTVLKSKVNPKPFPGTAAIEVPLPDSSEPLWVWIENIDPTPGSQLVMGQTASVMTTCGGPSGYTAFISVVLMSGEYTAHSIEVRMPRKLNVCELSGGSTYPVNVRCNGIGLRSNTTVSTTPFITHALTRVWVYKGQFVPADRCPDAVKEERLDWDPSF